MADSDTSKRQWRHKFAVFGFIAVLSLPLIKMTFGAGNGAPDGANEKRASFTGFNIHDPVNSYFNLVMYMKDVNDGYEDRIGFRSELLTLFRFCKLSLFHVTAFPEKVVFGTDHWFFLGDYYSDVIKESKGLFIFSESQLEIAENNLKRISGECRERGAKLYVSIAPNKHTICGKYLPIIGSGRPTKLDQLVTRMKYHDFHVIDLKRDFNRYGDTILFQRNNTHWTDFGAFLGYRTLMDFIVRDFPFLKVLKPDEFKYDTVNSENGDLTRMLSIKTSEKRVILKPKYASNAREEKDKLPVPDTYTGTHRYELRLTNPGRPLKALIFRDSFFDAMIPFIKESFGELVFIWGKYNRRLVDIEKPDLVIYEVVERDIDEFVDVRLE